MIKYESLGNGKIRAYSDAKKYINEQPTGIEDFFTEAINYGYINENGVGVFSNGRTYTESEKEIEK